MVAVYRPAGSSSSVCSRSSPRLSCVFLRATAISRSPFLSFLIIVAPDTVRPFWWKARRWLGRPSQRLAFHQKGLTVYGATITKNDKKGDRETAVARRNTQDSLGELRLHTEELLPAGRYTATIHFEAPIQDSMHGAYFCNYDMDGKKKQIVATQFESHSAREVFPCIDEPEAKATFDLTMITP